VTGPKIGILVGPLYEDIEVHYPLLRLAEEGATVVPIDFDPDATYKGRFWSLALAAKGRLSVPGETRPVYAGIHGMPVWAEARADTIDPDTLAALVIPGGYVADHLRRSEAVLALVRAMVDLDRTVAAICHGPWVMCSADVLRGREATGHWVVRPDVEGAGASWVDAPVVSDGPIVTSRFPDDLGHFCRAILDRI
jgi:protease I